jgi:hypothetical protein
MQMKIKRRATVLTLQGLALAGLLALTLCGCAAPAPAPPELTRIQLERVTLPPGLLTCMAEPPASDFTLQSQVADYLVQLQEAGADCRDTVNEIATIETQPPVGK